ncbi:hypothetical protein ABL78_1796 [Leptomonas seymouri]|uniref:SAM-dependent MTase RsmB/NOP-type domain-containing protein n=1 Tax=Leptomonas seymouri TaxID=5684 RepID=A0A0N1I8C6_LEPSE|nr:hypothetical protein ABL78_1796 [Leptomonas seymouri]|eukprot:KPI89060.1 hypothetical protein ABL78_1796 [Leptomonas seymouri]
MMQCTRRLFFDSFKAARGELEPLFSTMKSEEHLRKRVRQYVVPGLSHRRHRHFNERLGRAQQRSFYRTNVSLVLQEARRRASYRVAAAALDVALNETRLAHLAQEFDPAWVKDAVASCQSVEELRVVEGVLRKYEQQLLASGTTAGTAGFLLTAAFGRSLETVTERGCRLGDDDSLEASGSDGVRELSGEDQREAAKSMAASSRSPSALTGSGNEGALRSFVGLTGGDGVMAPPSSSELMRHARDDACVFTALAQPPSADALAVRGGSGLDASLWSSAEARAAAGLRRLQRQRNDVTAGPNVSFTRYFLHQGLVRHEGELMSLYQAMRSRPQDVAFRVVGGATGEREATGRSGALPPSLSCSPYADAVHDLLRHRRGICRVPWLPPSLGAYTLDTRDSVPHDTVLSNRHLLRSLARERFVVFQSLPSMLPVLLLDPKPGEAVLDLCASPGNKTGLILDAVCGAAATTASSEAPTSLLHGCVVANEAQASRIRDLQERLRDASPAVAVTRSRGQAFGALPSFTTGMTSNGRLLSAMTAADELGGASEGGLYDAVLVDAPCSGEGRMGRDALSWRLWHPGRGLEFFSLQCALLHRAVQLCRTGGRVVYATCTLNPIENEAVVAAVLRACAGAVELVPPPANLLAASSRNSLRSSAGEGGDGNEVPVLRLTPGLRRWDVPSSAGAFLRTLAEADAQGESRSRVLPEMFALEGEHEGKGGEEGGTMGAALHRCCRRVMPHLNGNADGFFVAVLRKKASVRRPSPSAFSRESASGRALFGVPRADASSLAVALAGGSNLLNDRGLVRVQGTNSIVQRHLGGFFASSPPAAAAHLANRREAASLQQQGGCTSVQGFLDRHGWTAMWCEGEGLRLLSTCAVQLLHRYSTVAGVAGGAAGHSSSASTSLAHSHSAELLDAGVVVVTAEGRLTERGASLLRSSATSRVVTLPLPYAQLLLANRTLDIGGSLRLMPAFMQEAELALNPHHGLLTSTGGCAGGEEAQPSSPEWCLNALSALRGGAAGNAIACIGVPSSSFSGTSVAAAAHGGGSSGSSSAWAAPLSQWSWPVRVEVLRPWSGAGDIASGLVRLHLTLPPASRHRTMALIGRLQGHAHRFCGTPAQQQQAQLQASATYSPSLVMRDSELHGVPTQASHQHRKLFKDPGRGQRSSDVDAARVGSRTSSAFLPDNSAAVFEL